MTVTVATTRLIELLTDALHTADDSCGGGIHVGTGRAGLGDEPGGRDMLTATSSTGSVMGHTWIPCTGGLIEAAVWPEDAARNVLAICKSLAKKGGDEQQHTVDITLSQADGDMVRAAIASALKTPARLADDATKHQRATGTRTTLDLPTEQHRRLKVLAAENGVTVQALVLAAVARAHPDLI